MKLFKFESSETNDDKCGCCNWSAAYLYWMSDKEENARKEIAEMGGDGNALCGFCMCDLLAEKSYNITHPTVNANCDGGTTCCDTAYLYELYWDDRKCNNAGNNSCMISAKINPDDFLKLINEYIREHPNDYNVEDFLEYLDISENHFWEVVDGYRLPHLWEKVDDEWRLKHVVE